MKKTREHFYKVGAVPLTNRGPMTKLEPHSPLGSSRVHDKYSTDSTLPAMGAAVSGS